MIITGIYFKDWRNLAEVNFRPDAATNIFLGQNAQGKTNILEAINFASLLRSRAGKESEIIRWGESVAILRISYSKADVSHELAIEISSERKRRILLDGNPIRPRELIGKLNSVFAENFLTHKFRKRRRFIFWSWRSTQSLLNCEMHC